MSFGQVALKKGVRVTGLRAWSAYGAPDSILIIRFFTWNRRTKQFEPWGRGEWLTGGDEHFETDTAGEGRTAVPDPIFPEGIPGPDYWDRPESRSFSDIVLDPDYDPILPGGGFTRGTYRYPPSWPSWLPYGFRVFRSGHHGDVAPGMTEEQHATIARAHGGHKGWTDQGPFFGLHFNMGDHDQHEVYLAAAVTSAPGWPSTTDHAFDESGRIGYRYHFPVGQSLWWIGTGAYFQWTNDQTADGSAQQNPFGQSHGPQHYIPFIDVGYEWKHATLPIAIEFGIELDDRGVFTGPTVGITYSPGSP